MHTKLLIDAIVQQTTVLIAELSTAAGIRAPLSHVADQVFLELAREIEAQGVGRKVVADMFGMALRTYQRRVQRLEESRSVRGQTLWEAVYEHIEQHPGLPRDELDARFRHDSADDVAAVLNDLTQSGLVYVAGRGSSASYRSVPRSERRGAQGNEALAALADLVWLTIGRARTIGRSELVRSLPADEASVLDALARLQREGLLRVEGDPDDPTLSAESFVVPIDATRGWEAAVFDHFSTVAVAIAAKLKLGPAARHLDQVGGATFTFDVYPEHPFEARVLGLLSRMRGEVDALWDEVSAYNKQHPVADDRKRKVAFYFGQTVDAPQDATRDTTRDTPHDHAPSRRHRHEPRPRRMSHELRTLLRMLRQLALCSLILGPLAGCYSGQAKPQSDSKSHWLARCDSDRDCGEHTCVCGVCTKACTRSSQCEVDEASTAACVDPSREGIASSCASVDEASATGAVCLRACGSDAQCKEDQRCLQGSCVETAVLDQVGQAGGPCTAAGSCEDSLMCEQAICIDSEIADAGAGMDTGVMDASDLDASDLDASEPDASLPDEGEGCTPETGCAGALSCIDDVCRDRCFDGSCIPRPLPAVCPAASSTRPACVSGACADGLICHLDGTCIEPGHCDEHGIAALPVVLSEEYSEWILGIDDTFVYTNAYPGGGGDRELRRRSLSGGDDALIASANYTVPHVAGNYAPIRFVIEGDTAWYPGEQSIYFEDGALLSFPILGNESPTVWGASGAFMAIDATNFYLSDTHDNTLRRVPKADLADDTSWDTVLDYRGESLGIFGLALDGTQLAVLLANGATRSLRIYDTADSLALITQRAVTAGPIPKGFSRLDPDYFITADATTLVRISRADGSIENLSTDLNQIHAVYGNYAYASNCDSTPTTRMTLVRIDLRDGTREELLPSTPGCAYGAVFSSPAGAFLVKDQRLFLLAR